MLAREDIRFIGQQQLGGRVRELAQYGLAADHDKVLDVRDGPRGSDYMFQLGTRPELGACSKLNFS
jgi:hypothetical protein